MAKKKKAKELTASLVQGPDGATYLENPPLTSLSGGINTAPGGSAPVDWTMGTGGGKFIGPSPEDMEAERRRRHAKIRFDQSIRASARGGGDILQTTDRVWTNPGGSKFGPTFPKARTPEPPLWRRIVGGPLGLAAAAATGALEMAHITHPHSQGLTEQAINLLPGVDNFDFGRATGSAPRLPEPPSWAPDWLFGGGGYYNALDASPTQTQLRSRQKPYEEDPHNFRTGRVRPVSRGEALAEYAYATGERKRPYTAKIQGMNFGAGVPSVKRGLTAGKIVEASPEIAENSWLINPIYDGWREGDSADNPLWTAVNTGVMHPSARAWSITNSQLVQRAKKLQDETADYQKKIAEAAVRKHMESWPTMNPAAAAITAYDGDAIQSWVNRYVNTLPTHTQEVDDPPITPPTGGGGGPSVKPTVNYTPTGSGGINLTRIRPDFSPDWTFTWPDHEVPTPPEFGNPVGTGQGEGSGMDATARCQKELMEVLEGRLQLSDVTEECKEFILNYLRRATSDTTQTSDRTRTRPPRHRTKRGKREVS